MPKAKAYRNLNRRDAVIYSLAVGGRVVDHRLIIVLDSVRMKHATAAQAHRCRFGGARGTGCREVCAWLLGDLADDQAADTEGMRRLSCDPRKVDHFQDAETGEPVHTAARVVLSPAGAFYLPTE